MLTCFIIDMDTETFITDYNEIPVKEILNKPNYLLWIDMESPTDKEVLLLSDDFGFHELSIEDCIFPQNLPKIDAFDTYCFIAVHSISQELEIKEELKIIEINIFLGKNFIVTVHDQSSPIITILKEKVRQDHSILLKGTDFLLHTILDKIVDNYLPLAEQIDDKIEEIEEKVLTNPTGENISYILDLKRYILSLRKIIIPQRVVISRLSRGDISFVSSKTLMYFRDIYDHLVRIGDMLDMYRELLTNTLEVYLSGTSTKLNEVIKVLTVIATFMMPLTLITSYYGMNIPLPEFTEDGNGIFIVWSLMIGVTVGLFVFFKYKRWL